MKVKFLLFIAMTLPMALVAPCLSQTGTATDSMSVAAGDEVWLVSARNFDGCSPPSIEQLRCQVYCNGQWIDQPIPALQASNDTMPTVVFVHGYQTDLQDARTRGIQVYQNLFLKCRQTGPVRYIVWAWKSERETIRPIADFDMKSRRAVALGDIFALTINELGQSPPTIVGYSLGVQIVVSAFAQSSYYAGNPVQVAIVAAANDCGFASCCDQMANCGNIQQSVVFYNDRDRAIRAANVICRMKYGSQFQPFQNLASQNTCSLGQVCIVDISGIAARRHSVVLYTALPVVQSQIQQMVMNR